MVCVHIAAMGGLVFKILKSAGHDDHSAVWQCDLVFGAIRAQHTALVFLDSCSRQYLLEMLLLLAFILSGVHLVSFLLMVCSESRGDLGPLFWCAFFACL